MTVNYSLDVATSEGSFIRLLFRWRGSIYKLLWRHCVVFLVVYFSISLVYRLALTDQHQRLFERAVIFCDKAQTSIPLTFLLGFYVALVVKRWWDMFSCISWPDRLAMCVSALIVGRDEKGRMLRRTLMRYVNLSSVLGLRLLSTAVKKRFPTLDHLRNAGLMTEEDQLLYEKTEEAHSKHWISTYLPCAWAITLIRKARCESRIESDTAMLKLIDEVNLMRNSILMLSCYDWVNIPLVYTQVVTIAVYSFFAVSLMGKQYLDSNKGIAGHEVDAYFPLVTVLQLFFYLGWLMVAETLINPFGEDDDDFEVNFILERNLQASYYFVDDNYDVIPSLEHDAHWDQDTVDVPHTAASVGLKDDGFEGSTQPVTLSPRKKEIATSPVNRENSFLSRGSFRVVSPSVVASHLPSDRRPSYGRSSSFQPPYKDDEVFMTGESQQQRQFSKSITNVWRFPSNRSSSVDATAPANFDAKSGGHPPHCALDFKAEEVSPIYASNAALETISEDASTLNESRDPLICNLTFEGDENTLNQHAKDC